MKSKSLVSPHLPFSICIDSLTVLISQPIASDLHSSPNNQHNRLFLHFKLKNEMHTSPTLLGMFHAPLFHVHFPVKDGLYFLLVVVLLLWLTAVFTS